MGWLENKIREVCADMMLIHGIDHHADALVPPNAPGVTTLDFGDNPTWDSAAFFDVGNRTKITVPPGLGGRYSVTATLRWDRHTGVFTTAERDGGRFYAELATNAHPAGHFPAARGSAAPIANSPKTVHHLLWEGPLEAGHYVEILARSTVQALDASGRPTVNVLLAAWLTMRRLGVQA